MSFILGHPQAVWYIVVCITLHRENWGCIWGSWVTGRIKERKPSKVAKCVYCISSPNSLYNNEQASQTISVNVMMVGCRKINSMGIKNHHKHNLSELHRVHNIKFGTTEAVSYLQFHSVILRKKCNNLTLSKEPCMLTSKTWSQ